MEDRPAKPQRFKVAEAKAKFSDKLSLSTPLERFLPMQLALNRFELLPIAFAHAARASALPFHHRDPFDRLLVSQALTDDLPIVTRDPVFKRYGARRVW